MRIYPLFFTIPLVLAACDNSQRSAVEPPVVSIPEVQMCKKIITTVSEIVAADRLPGGRKHALFQNEALAIENDVGPIWWDQCLKTVTPAMERCYQDAQNPKQAKKCASLVKSGTS